jgi:hypothetical protein
MVPNVSSGPWSSHSWPRLLFRPRTRTCSRWSRSVAADKVVSFGRELGVLTPTFNMMYAALKPYANGAPK